METETQHISGKEVLVNAIENTSGIYIQQFNLCNEALSEKAVHDFRVSIRRFSAVVSLTGQIIGSERNDDIKKKLKLQVKTFNPLRDIQVQVLRVIDFVYTYPVLYHYYHYLIYKEEKQIQGLDKAIKDFDIEEISKLIAEIKMELNSFIKVNSINNNHLMEVAHERYNIVLSRFELAKPDDPATIHKTRLAFKKFRYSMEILQPITGMTEEDFLEMKSFQTVMGKIQDNVVFYSRLKEFIESQNDVSSELLNPVEKAILDERKNLISEFFNTFENIKAFWKPEYLK